MFKYKKYKIEIKYLRKKKYNYYFIGLFFVNKKKD